MMLIMDALYVFPSFIYMLVLVVVLGPGMWQTTIAITIGRIPYNYRLIRSLTISVKERGFIEAAKVLGADNWYIIKTHIMPYYISILFVAVSLGMASGTLAISGLGFLGLGIPPPTPEWGTELASGRNFLLGGHWWLVVFPGFFVMIAMLGFNLLSEGLDTILNPTVRRLK
jgi:peptide/nickel transport system permease protein